jgi:hypothetical protein
LQAAQSRDLATEYSLETNIQGEAVTFIRTNSAGVVSVPAVGLGTSTLQRDAVLASSNLTSAHSRTQQRDTQIAPLQKYLATFPDPNTYWLDHYAVRTGKVVDGLEVYDLGTAPGLTY